MISRLFYIFRLKASFCAFCLCFLLYGCQLTPQAQEEYDPDRAALARLKLGLAYLKEASLSDENIKLAHYNLNLANQYSPNNPDVMLGLALFDQYVGENQEAEQIYQKIIQYEPQNGLYLVHYGTFLCQNDHYPEAKSAFERALQLQDKTWKADALEQLGYCAIQQKDKKSAQDSFNRLFSHYPTKRQQVKQTGEYYIQKGNVQIGNQLIQIAEFSSL